VFFSEILGFFVVCFAVIAVVLYLILSMVVLMIVQQCTVVRDSSVRHRHWTSARRTSIRQQRHSARRRRPPSGLGLHQPGRTGQQGGPVGGAWPVCRGLFAVYFVSLSTTFYCLCQLTLYGVSGVGLAVPGRVTFLGVRLRWIVLRLRQFI